MPLWNSAKARVQLRLSVQRLRTLQQKKEAQAKASRRDIAALLERSKLETARIKVETIINEDIHVELLELLELYCELLLARFGLLEQNTREPDPGVSEGINSIIFAAPRTELKELHVLRDLLMHKYGREFSVAVMENRDGCVTDRVVRKLGMVTPSTELVDAYLMEIAKAYGVKWEPPVRKGDGDTDLDVPGGGVKESAPQDASEPVLSTDVNVKSGPAIGSTPKLPDIPPTEDEDGEAGLPKYSETKQEAATTKPSSPKITEDDFEALTKRFAALKKR